MDKRTYYHKNVVNLTKDQYLANRHIYFSNSPNYVGFVLIYKYFILSKIIKRNILLNLQKISNLTYT